MRLDSSPSAQERLIAELAANRVIPVPVLRPVGGKRSVATDPASLTSPTLSVQSKAQGKYHAAFRNPASRVRGAYLYPVWLRGSGYSAKSNHDNPERFLVTS
ncbi:MAG: hypothetical protein OXT72_05050 [Gammaproteobacteria bacterium]|nr:hypothetical protein [Gammaproteobacteria bacterium]MDE0247720.1 hypothetical protein [Gammaproteobacteria bacterium]